MMKPLKEAKTYREAMDELQQIVMRLREADDVDVDELLRDVSRAKALIDFCGDKIRRADVQIQNVLRALRSDGRAEDDLPPSETDDGTGGLFT